MPQAAMLDIPDIGGMMTMKGPLQETTKGEKKYAWVVAFTHQVACEIAPKTGLPRPAGLTSKKPVVTQSEFVITKKLDFTTPLFHDAHKDGKVLSPWKLHLFQIPASGSANNYFIISLTGAKIKSIKTIKPAMLGQVSGMYHEVEEVAFTYEKITFEAREVPRGLDYGNAPGDTHAYTVPIEPDWAEEKARAMVEKMYGMLSDRIKGEVKAKLLEEGIITEDGLPGANFPE